MTRPPALTTAGGGPPQLSVYGANPNLPPTAVGGSMVTTTVSVSNTTVSQPVRKEKAEEIGRKEEEREG